MATSLWFLGCVALAGCGDAGALDAAEPADTPDASTSAPELDASASARRDARVDKPTREIADAGAKLPDGALPHQPDAGPADAGSAGDSQGGERPGFQLIFRDEFDGPSGTLPDATKWVFETGGGGFGNNELEHYTARPENASLDGQGKLVITARAESFMGSKYTSARLKTAGKFEHAYGRYEARLRIPTGRGIWPAFWMLGADIGTTGWPACGEIDIMENIGSEPTLVHGTLHGPGYSGGNSIGKSVELPDKARFTDDFHEFAVEWEVDVVRWYMDGKLYQTRTPKDLPGKWVYDHPHFLLLNLAVGGQWPGNPDGTTVFPQQLTVDYVRVYERI